MVMEMMMDQALGSRIRAGRGSLIRSHRGRNQFYWSTTYEMRNRNCRRNTVGLPISGPTGTGNRFNTFFILPPLSNRWIFHICIVVLTRCYKVLIFSFRFAVLLLLFLRFLAGCRTRRLNQVQFLFDILACVIWYCCLFIRVPFYVLLVFIAMCAVFWLFWLSCQYLPSDWLERLLLCFLGQLSHLPYSVLGASVTNLNEPPRALATSTIMWVRSQFHPFWAVVNKSNAG